jgi:alkylhydroperoxidase family enzyme
MLVWDPEGADARVWAMLREHLTDAQIVELGSFIAVTYGQQRVIKTWDVGHGELPGDPGAGLAPARERR